MAKSNGIEAKLMEELDAQTEPLAAWKASKKDVQLGSAATRAVPEYSVGIKGPKLLDMIESYALTFYGAMGKAGTGDKKHLAHILRNALGDENYRRFREALKIGNIDQANFLAITAYQNEIQQSQLTGISEKLGLTEPKTREDIGKKLVKRVGAGANDYFLAAANPGLAVGILKEQKDLAERLTYAP